MPLRCVTQLLVNAFCTRGLLVYGMGHLIEEHITSRPPIEDWRHGDLILL